LSKTARYSTIYTRFIFSGLIYGQILTEYPIIQDDKVIKVECVAALFEDHEFRGAPKVDNDELVVSVTSWVGV